MKQSTSKEPAWRLTAECPRCGNDLVVRSARRDHQPFIGCVSYPTCRFTCEYDEALQHLAHAPGVVAVVQHLELANQRLAAEVSRLEVARQSLAAQVARLSLTTNLRTLPNSEGLTRALTQLVSVAHPDRWDQGQPAAELAHVITQALLKLRTQLQRGR